MKLVLGIECTAHTFGIGLIDIDTRNILFNKKNVYSDEHAGMDPRKLSEFHINNFESILIEAKNYLASINKSFSDLFLISFSQGPGQGNSLKVAGLVAKTLALKHNIKIVGVNHIRSHLEIGKMHTGFEDPLFLNITGVNSQVVASREIDIEEKKVQRSSSDYVVYGETEDIGLGNLLDSVARIFDLGFPGGPVIEKIALTGGRLMEIPYTIKGMNVSFAGTISNVKQKKEMFEKNKPITLVSGTEIIYKDYNIFLADLCYSLQETVFAMIQEIAERGLAYTNKKELVLVGGVAANKRFVEMTKAMCSLREVKYDALPLPLCMDNGIMIAWAGYVKKLENRIKEETSVTKKKTCENEKIDISGLKPMPYITVENNI
jgi:glycoprotease/Kae1 family metallohydrolase